MGRSHEIEVVMSGGALDNFFSLSIRNGSDPSLEGRVTKELNRLKSITPPLRGDKKVLSESELDRLARCHVGLGVDLLKDRT